MFPAQTMAVIIVAGAGDVVSASNWRPGLTARGAGWFVLCLFAAAKGLR
jgi:hypothetical protein